MPKRSIINPSKEQKVIVDLCRAQNVLVSARPGSGKTATAEAIVAAYPTRNIAVLTYSKRLQIETAFRLEGYFNSHAFTFHGMACRLFSKNVFNDAILRDLRQQGHIPAWRGTPFDVVILDEFQDCTDDLFWLVCAFLSAVTEAKSGDAPQIVILGDERQAIYGFRGADSRYLSLASSSMKSLSPYPWSHLTLSKSFRLSHESAAFVNKVYLKGEECIVGTHSGPKPLYIHGNMFNGVEFIAKHLFPLIEAYGPENTAFLAPTLRNNRPMQYLTNLLSEAYNVPIAVTISDDVPLNDQALQGKLCVSTYHQFKGNERDLVIVYGVDASYFEVLARDSPDDECPNESFVALTRARKQLVVMHHNKTDAMPFVDTAEIYKVAKYVALPGPKEVLGPAESRGSTSIGLLLPKSVQASELARHVPQEILHALCQQNIRIVKMREPVPDKRSINAPDVVLSDPEKRHFEAVSDINGLAVVAAYEIALSSTLTSFEACGKRKLSSPLPIPDEINAQATWLCREACEFEAWASNYRSRRRQMQHHAFDWLGPYLAASRDRLMEQFPPTDKMKFEVPFKEERFSIEDGRNGLQTTRLEGIADIIQFKSTTQPPLNEKDGSTTDSTASLLKDYKAIAIWEVKFVSQLSFEHVIQACVYAYLWCRTRQRRIPPEIILFNVRNAEKWRIIPHQRVSSLRNVVEGVMIAKYSTRRPLTAELFLEKCAATRAEVGGETKMSRKSI